MKIHRFHIWNIYFLMALISNFSVLDDKRVLHECISANNCFSVNILKIRTSFKCPVITLHIYRQTNCQHLCVLSKSKEFLWMCLVQTFLSAIYMTRNTQHWYDVLHIVTHYQKLSLKRFWELLIIQSNVVNVKALLNSN